MRRLASLVLGLAAFSGAAALGARDASAYCRSTTCDSPEIFTPCDMVTPGCEPLAWRRTCIGWNLHEAGSKKIPFDVTELILENSFLTWQNAFCGPGIRLQYLGTVRCGQVEYNSLSGNANVVVFRDDVWPHEGGEHNIALTTVTFDVTTGEIFDADIEVNTAQFELTWDDAMVNYDFQSIMTHEVGHFLGLSHSSVMEATMYRHYDVGSVVFRDLHEDDEQAICDTYAPFGALPPPCNPIPRHGFSPDCSKAQTEGQCSAAGAVSGARGTSTRPPSAFSVLLVAGGALVALGRRRRLAEPRARTGARLR